ncbi:carbohydrate ABC transporter permease [Cohnella fermenti]|uniref:Carbohydrate ABC transporter permease n=1 Tax=Cohnella fermenti TaxID=2565925 RepID=A0A4S4BK57_9BACL|nr:carbohydrate ABC transporter permease [Cohnella fermenti]THF74834.1 carbohydrate ABC transporter permease [Cohnella fermenti]
MKRPFALGGTLFRTANHLFLVLLSLACVLPIVHVLAVSLSAQTAVSAGEVLFRPVDFTVQSFDFVVHKPEFFVAMSVTLKRVALGLSLNMLLTMLVAYPLSKRVGQFKLRTGYAWFFVATMLFHGGLIPTFLTVKYTGIMDSVWSLVLPGAVPVFNVVLLLNFFRNLPHALEEAAIVDGAGVWTCLWRIYVPLSLPALATISLFTVVGHWNAWFDGLIYMNSLNHYPLSSYLQTVIIQQDLSRSAVTQDEIELYMNVSAKTIKSAQTFVGMLPILLVYPFLQRYFVKGIVMGSVKE